MSENPVIVCKATQWIKIRAVLIILMFGVFAYLFYSDGTVGYREKNEKFMFHSLFIRDASEALKGIESEEEWKEYVQQQTVSTLSEEECPLPEGFDRNQAWPELLLNGYEPLKNKTSGASDLWQEYTREKGWPIEPPEKLYDQGKLTEQFVMAGICGALVLVVLFLFIRTLGRSMQVTPSAYIAPGGTVVPYSSMKRIDARKWDVKGVALIEYDDAGKSKKVKVDGMIYGQFKEADGQPAERLYEYILENFKGELVEYEKDEYEAAEEGESEDAADNKNSDTAANS